MHPHRLLAVALAFAPFLGPAAEPPCARVAFEYANETDAMVMLVGRLIVTDGERKREQVTREGLPLRPGAVARSEARLCVTPASQAVHRVQMLGTAGVVEDAFTGALGPRIRCRVSVVGLGPGWARHRCDAE